MPVFPPLCIGINRFFRLKFFFFLEVYSHKILVCLRYVTFLKIAGSRASRQRGGPTAAARPGIPGGKRARGIERRRHGGRGGRCQPPLPRRGRDAVPGVHLGYGSERPPLRERRLPQGRGLPAVPHGMRRHRRELPPSNYSAWIASPVAVLTASSKAAPRFPRRLRQRSVTPLLAVIPALS